MQRGEGFARQAQAADGGINLTIAEARQRAHWYKQRAARPRRQLHRRQLAIGQGHQPAGGKMNLQGLRFIGQIAEIQRQTRSIAAGEEARVFSSAMTGAATTTLSSLLPKSSAVHAWPSPAARR